MSLLRVCRSVSLLEGRQLPRSNINVDMWRDLAPLTRLELEERPSRATTVTNVKQKASLDRSDLAKESELPNLISSSSKQR